MKMTSEQKKALNVLGIIAVVILSVWFVLLVIEVINMPDPPGRQWVPSRH